MQKFKNTNEALKYGDSIKNNPSLIEELRKQRKSLVNKCRLLMEEGKEGEALFLASGQSQFTREAIEQAEKQILID